MGGFAVVCEFGGAGLGFGVEAGEGVIGVGGVR